MKNIRFVLLLTVAALLCGMGAKAQNTFYSQYLNAPMYTNPANVGLADHTRVMVNYRTSYMRSGSSVAIPSFSVMHPFLRSSGSLLGGAGLTVVRDDGNGILSTTGVAGSFSYNIPVNERNLIGIGVQPGFFSQKINTDKMTTDSQFQNGGFNPGSNINENFSGMNGNYFSVSTGATWSHRNLDGEQSSFVGVGFYNLNQPDMALMGGPKVKMPMSLVVNAGVTVFDNGQFSIMPTMRYVGQKDVDQFLLGSMFRYDFSPEVPSSYLAVGGWYGIESVSVFLIEAGIKNLVAAFSYDFSTAGQFESNPANNAMEVTLAWRMFRKKDKPVAQPEPEPEPVAVVPPVVTPEPVKPAEPAPVPVKVVTGVTGGVVDNVTGSPVAANIQLVDKANGQVLKTLQAGPDGRYTVKPDAPGEYLIKANAPGYTAVSLPLSYADEDQPLDVRLEPLKANTKFEMERINFETGSYNLTPASMVELDKLVGFMNDNPSVKVAIEGHTDNVGSAASNLRLSENRAKAVYDAMVQKGIAPERLSYKGYGITKPVVPNTTPENRATNRRIDFVIQ